MNGPDTGTDGVSRGGRRRGLFFLKLAVSVSLLAYLLSLVDLGGVSRSFQDFNPGFLLAAFGLLMCQSLFSTFKWQTLLKADSAVLRFSYLLKTYLISNFFSLFLPTSFGGDVYRVVAVRKVAGSTAKTASSVLFDRLTGLFALLSIAAISYVTFTDFPYKPAVVVGYAAGVGVFWLGASGWIVRRFGGAQNRLVRKGLKIFESFHVYGRNRNCLVIALLVSLAFQLNVVFINKMYSLTLGLNVPLQTLLVIIPLVYLTEAIPLSINGLGFREGAFVFFYEMTGHTAEAGLAVSLLVLMMRYGVGLIGGSLLVISVWQGRHGRLAGDDRSPS